MYSSRLPSLAFAFTRLSFWHPFAWRILPFAPIVPTLVIALAVAAVPTVASVVRGKSVLSYSLVLSYVYCFVGWIVSETALSIPVFRIKPARPCVFPFSK